VAVGGSDLAREDHLDTGEQRVGGLGFAAHAGIFQDQHATLGFLGRDQRARFHHQALDVIVVPDHRRAARQWLLGDDVLHHLPQRRHVVLGDALVIRLPHGLDIVLGARGLALGSLAGGRACHWRSPFGRLGDAD
jgi:hypothetical protein